MFDWAQKTAQATRLISPACNGNNVALKICDMVSTLDDGSFFEKIIDHGREIKIESKVQTESKKYTAAIVISMYLDSLGLGETELNK